MSESPPSSPELRHPATLPAVPWTALDAATVFLGWLVLAQVLSALIALALPAQAARATALPATSALMAVLTVAWIAARHREGLGELVGRLPVLGDLGAGLGHGIVAFLVFNVGFAALMTLYANLTGGEVPAVQEGLRETILDARLGVIAIASAVVLAPLAEELLFRGVLFRGLRGSLSSWPAIGLSGLIFGLIHLQPTLEGTLYALVVLGAFGGYLAWVFDRRGSLATPIVMHVTFNGLAVGALFVTV